MTKPSAMSKAQLAQAYAPDLSPSSALNRLREWIDLNPQLTEALKDTHYHRRQKQLTPLQVALIYRYLGEP